MRVQCPSCASAYNFDESLIGPGGISLKCTACGHVFQLAALTALAPGNVRVRRASTGEVHDFVDVAEVQQAILEQRFSRSDLLSRTGSHWAPIAQVPELQNALALSELTTSTEPLSPQPRAVTSPPGNTQIFAQQVVSQPVAPVISAGATRAMVTDGAPHRRIQATSGSQPIIETRPFARQTGQAPAMPDPVFEGPSRNVAMAVARIDTAEVDRDRVLRGRAQGAGGRDDGWALESPKPPVQEWSVGDAPIRSARVEPGRRAPDPVDTGSFEDVRPLAGARRAGSWPIAGAIVLSTLIVVVAAVPDFRNALLGRTGAPPDASAAEATGAASTADAGSVDDAAPGLLDATAGSATTPGDPTPTGAAGLGSGVAADAEADGGPDGAPAPATEADAAAQPDAAVASRDAAPSPEPPRAEGTSHDALMQRGNAALNAGRHEAALAAFSEAADRYNRTEAHVGVARVFAATGRRELAIARYERALSDNARYQPAWIELAALLEDEGQRDRAIEAYRQVLEIRDTGSAADRARTALGRLGAE